MSRGTGGMGVSVWCQLGTGFPGFRGAIGPDNYYPVTTTDGPPVCRASLAAFVSASLLLLRTQRGCQLGVSSVPTECHSVPAHVTGECQNGPWGVQLWPVRLRARGGRDPMAHTWGRVICTAIVVD